MIVGTAGHIDHGKTALVRALTGVDADRLAEEKTRGITIELGFAYADLGGGGITGFVDVPGHERFVHTMLAGAGGIDLALLVVAADDGVMPQTREHLAILDLLGVHRGIVGLSKADLADQARRTAVTAEIKALLDGTGLDGAPVIPVSTVTGEGIEALRAALAEAEAETTARAEDARFRLGVDRSFILKGAGTVVTGTVLTGRVAVGDTVMVSPRALTARVRAIHAQNQPVQVGVAGQRCALNLAGEGIGREAIQRGDMIVDPALHGPAERIDASLRVLGSEARPIGTWFPARLHSGAAEVGARIVPLADPLAPGTEGPVQLVLDQPIAAAVGDRYILRDVSARRTIGGGAFLDLRAPARRRRTPERLAQLEAAARPDPAEALQAMLAAPPHVVDLTAFLRDRALGPDEAKRVTEGVTVLESGAARVALSPLTHRGLVAGMLDALARFHEDSPEMQGLGRERLRLALTPRLPKEAFAAFVAERIAAGDIVAEGAFLRLPGHVVRLSEEDEALYARILPELSGEARFRPPRVRDMATEWDVPEADVRRVLRMAARQGRVDQIRNDHFFLRPTTAEMVRIIADVQAEAPDGWVTAAAFRDRLQNGRKVAIEILDFYDRQGVTLRRGDLRRINPHRADLFG
ncbi:selenocysteine-specific translation elongation factor [Paracoccus sp. MC1862]|uniref:selenocysteine-specific translation elongation factor n=1 Tax=Paracoccus sp. MC1862 TaxID=2760307 RepID=UPI0016024DD0|nr:selenocysteine-specific translation elongation factor [Paracoccus sp. MC1862]MBB1497910.1 selenocysteine-specific translation elongation factor [Paracoccus sp. MC1862]QQO44304.1 selenocysteine-specific translation elongation factor [Paracoccus sp. MC1862]